MNKHENLQRDIRILEDEVKMIKDSKRTWIASSIAFGFILVMLSVFLFIYPEEMGVYKQGFQDGQANCSNEYKGFLKLSSFEIEYNETGIPEFAIWYSFNSDSDYDYRGLICPEGFKLNITSPREIGCVKQ